MNSKLKPIEHGIDLWSIRVSEQMGSETELSGLLSPSEEARAQRFIKPTDQRRYRITRGVLRRTLASYIDTPPESICFERNEHGKPFLSDSPVFFNLSHSNDRLLIAVSAGRELGIDVEFRRQKFDPAAIVNRWFSKAEKEAFQNGTDFFDLWAKKEAYVKALGVGIYKNFHTFTVPFPRLGTMDDWIFQTLEIDADYAAALVYPTPEQPLRIRELS
jgi:4'-phosphopantetheinyl transferase